MEALVKKLNLTSQQHGLLLNLPAELTALADAFAARIILSTQPEALQKVDFVMAFVQQLKQVEQLADWVATHTEDDALVWLVYPKQTSRSYRCDFNRDTGWSSMGDAGFEPVRMVAVSSDWSALRFRRASFIKKMARDPKLALSAEGRSRTGSTV